LLEHAGAEEERLAAEADPAEAGSPERWSAGELLAHIGDERAREVQALAQESPVDCDERDHREQYLDVAGTSIDEGAARARRSLDQLVRAVAALVA
jgi:hypothetical protein